MTKIHSINSNQLYLAQNAEVSLKLAGNTAQVTFTAGNSRKCLIKNLSKDEFVDLSTGEVKKRRHTENRFQSPKSVRKSINSLMDLIRCNATSHANCLCRIQDNSDQGSQYTFKAFTDYCESVGITQSMRMAGYPYDNAPMERYFNTLKNEEIDLHDYRDEQELYDAVEDFAYVKYNHERPHSYNNYRTPFEARYVA
jgi:hypothetical protein